MISSFTRTLINHRTRIILLLSLFFLSSCGPAVSTRVVDPSSSLSESRLDITTSDNFSPETSQAIRLANLKDSDALEQGAAFVTDPLFQKFSSEVQRNYVGSELALGRAFRLEKKDPARAVGYFLRAAQLSTIGGLSEGCRGAFDVRCDGFKAFYGRAVMGVLNHYLKNSWAPIVSTADGAAQPTQYTVSVGHESVLESPEKYDFIQPSASIGLKGLPNRYHRWGVGLALTACRRKEANTNYDNYLPKTGMCLPLNAIFNFDTEGCSETSCRVTLSLHDALKKDFLVTESGSNIPLQADFTAPFAKVLERSGIGGWDGLFDAFSGNEQLLKETGFYSYEPYDPNKIPLITVHGLFSSPATWISLHNDLMGDPLLRKNFQIWNYLYPTNLPILINARTFRTKLDELETFMAGYKAERKSALAGMVVVAHSMGGLLTKTAVSTCSDQLEKIFVADPAQIRTLDLETKSELQSLLEFKSKEFIDRVIFVAVPHRGSVVSDNLAGRIGRWLISIPATITATTKRIVDNTRSILNPKLGSDFTSGSLSSVKGLSPSNPVLQALAAIPIDSRIPFHSIMGDQGRGDSPESSDGVVDYKSSHLDGAQSELTVPSDHTAHDNPAAVQEIKRILHLHIESRVEQAPDRKVVQR